MKDFNIKKLLKILAISFIVLTIYNIYTIFSTAKFSYTTFFVFTNTLYKPLSLFNALIIVAIVFVFYTMFFSDDTKKHSLKKTLLYSIFIVAFTTLIYCLCLCCILFFYGFKRYGLNYNEILSSMIPLLTYKSLIILSLSIFVLLSFFIWDNNTSILKLLYIAILYVLYKLYEFNPLISVIPSIKLNDYFYTHLYFMLTNLVAVIIIILMFLLLKKKLKLGVLLIFPVILLSFISFKTYTRNATLAPTEISVKNNKSDDIVTDYTVNEYSMDINLNEDFYNRCEIKITLNNPSIKTLKFNLYEKSNITNLKINNITPSYEMKDSWLYIDIPHEIKDTSLSVTIEYSSYIYTFVSYHAIRYKDNLSIETDSLTDKYGFLSSRFPWYPILDNTEKIFNITINNCNSSLLSNLNTTSCNNNYTLKGSAKNIFIYKDDISQITYENYNFIGSKQVLNHTDTIDRILKKLKPDEFLQQKKSVNLDNIKNIIILPPSCSINEIIIEDTLIVSISEPVFKH